MRHYQPSLLVTSLVGFATLALYQFVVPASLYEARFADWLRLNQDLSQGHVLYQLAHLASWSIYPAMAGLIIWQLWSHRRQSKSEAWIRDGAIISIFLIDLLKSIFGRPRPLITDDLPSIAASSFPSTHVYAACIWLLVIFHTLKPTTPWARLLYLYPVLVAWSRLIVYAHHPTDILASLFLAIATWQAFLWSASKVQAEPL